MIQVDYPIPWFVNEEQVVKSVTEKPKVEYRSTAEKKDGLSSYVGGSWKYGELGTVLPSDRRQVENLTGKPIKVSLTKGVAIVHPPINNRTVLKDPKVIITFQIRNFILNNLVVDRVNTSNAIDDLLLCRLMEFKENKLEQLGDHINRTLMEPMTVTVTVTIKEDILNTRGYLYSEMLGMEITNNEQDVNSDTATNPVREAGIKAVLPREGEPTDSKRSIVFLVDPENKCQTLYSKLHGYVSPVPNLRNETRDPGLYMAVKSPNEEPKFGFIRLEEVLEGEKIKEFDVYMTESEARKGEQSGYTTKLDKEVKEGRRIIKKLEEDNKSLTEELALIKELSKRTKELEGIEKRILASQNKYHLDLAKTNRGKDDFMDSVKAVGLVVTTGVTLWKLFT